MFPVRCLYPKMDWPPEATGAVIDANLRMASAYADLMAAVGDDKAREIALTLVDPANVRTGKGAHNAKYNAELALRYELAPDGEKEAAAADVARRYKREPAAALRQVRRIQNRGLTWQEMVAAPPLLLNSYAVARQQIFEAGLLAEAAAERAGDK